MLSIVTAPNPVLSTKAKPVARVDKAILNLVEQMEESLDKATDPIGVGLAAPQVGKSLDLFITKPTAKSKMFVFINPKITAKLPLKEEKDNKKTFKLEGCLSLVNIWGEVQRAPEITVEYLDETGKEHKRQFQGFMATIIQHEVDHLNGVLFPKRVLEQKGTLYQSYKNSKGEDEFEELKI
jgi:peptide deformylase